MMAFQTEMQTKALLMALPTINKPVVKGEVGVVLSLLSQLAC